MRCDARRDEAATQSIFTGSAKRRSGSKQGTEGEDEKRERGGRQIEQSAESTWVWLDFGSCNYLARFWHANFFLECVARKCLNDTRFRQAAIRNISEKKNKKIIAENYSYIKAPPAAKRLHCALHIDYGLKGADKRHNPTPTQIAHSEAFKSSLVFGMPERFLQHLMGLAKDLRTHQPHGKVKEREGDSGRLVLHLCIHNA